MTTEKAAPTPRTDEFCVSHIPREPDPDGLNPYLVMSADLADFARELERESIRLAERLKEAREALKQAAIAIESAARHGVDQDHPMYASLMRDAKKARDALLRSGEGE